MGSNKESPLDPASDKRWTFPQNARVVDDDDDQPTPDAVVSTVAPQEAIQLCERLENNGIPCERVWATAKGADPDEQRLVEVRVPAANLGAAQLICDGHEPAMTAADHHFEAESAADRIDAFICPVCNKQTLVNAGLSPAMATARNWLMFLIVLPIIIGIFSHESPNTFGTDLSESAPAVLVACSVAALVAFVIVLLAERNRHCVECGWRSDTQK